MHSLCRLDRNYQDIVKNVSSITLLYSTRITTNPAFTVGPCLSKEDMFQDCQWMPETMDSTEPYTYYLFLYILTIKLNL